MATLGELEILNELIESSKNLIRVRILGRSLPARGERFPLIGLIIGPEDRTLPTFGLFGGVHGLEHIGTQVLLSFLGSLLEAMRWDEDCVRRFERCRFVSIPIVNPGGMFLEIRANPRGVDLMRNSPVEAVEPVPVLFGGHRLSPKLPWYRGDGQGPMEPEAQALVDFVVQEMFAARIGLSLDLHSGFGFRDRLWYPYAKQRGGFPRLPEVRGLARLLERTYPHHRYCIETQSDSYLTSGDLWDHLFDLHLARHGLDGPVFIPWTLEMGSWRWLRKNPWQLFTAYGAFNPVVPHRLRRVMRHHLLLLDFFLRATCNPGSWCPAEKRQADVP